jgi:predicted nucleic acid-binding protein
MTRAEIRLGAGKANWGPRTLALLDRYLSNYDIRFPDERTCDLWAEITLDATRRGCPIGAQAAMFLW